MNKLPCRECICLAKCMTNIPESNSCGYEDIDPDDDYFFWQYVNELINDCRLMTEYIGRDTYDQGHRTRRVRAARFFKRGYEYDHH